MTKAVEKPKRVKVTLACITCRKKKVKCDGNKPCCARCNNMGLLCEFSDPPRKRGPPKHNIEVIESRAHRLESLLGPPPPATDPYQVVETNAFLQLVTGAVEALKNKWRTECLLTGGPMTNLINDTLSHQFKLQLAEKYFTNFNLFLPILSRHHFLHRLAHAPQEMDPLLCYAVCTMGSRYLDQRDDMERLYSERCLVYFEKLKMNEPTLANVQGVIIFCWYVYMMGDLKKCACLRRHLVDYVRRLNLGKNADPSLSIVQTEERRRTFWVIHVTDAWLSFYTNTRLINMKKEGWDCKKPILEDNQLQALDSRNLKWKVDTPPQVLLKDETTEAVLQIPSFDELIQLTSIVGDMFDWLQQFPDRPAHHLKSQLDDWFRHLPSYLELGNKGDDDYNSPAPIAKTIRILYHTVQIIMYQSPLNLDVDQYTRRHICRTAADSIVYIASQMLHQQDMLKLYNTFTMSITLATSVHLEFMNNNTQLGTSIRVLKDANCSYLTRVDFDRLVDRYLSNRCGLVLNDEFKSSHQLAAMWHRSRDLFPPKEQPLDLDGLLNGSIADLILGDGGGGQFEQTWTLSNPILKETTGSTSSLDSTASPSSTYSPTHSPQDRQENCIRLLPASTLLALPQPITPQGDLAHSFIV